MFFLVFVLFTSRWSVRKVLDCFLICTFVQNYNHTVRFFFDTWQLVQMAHCIFCCLFWTTRNYEDDGVIFALWAHFYLILGGLHWIIVLKYWNKCPFATCKLRIFVHFANNFRRKCIVNRKCSANDMGVLTLNCNIMNIAYSSKQ